MSPRAKSLLSLAIMATVSIVVLVYFRTHLDTVDVWLIKLGLWGPLAVIALYTILSLTPIPTDPLTVMLGALYGPLWGLLISWAGNTAAALAEYFVAYHVNQVSDFEHLKKKLPWGLANAPVDSIWFLTLGRIVPGFGSKIVSVMAGLYEVKLPRYLITTALMNLVGSIGYVLGGFFLTRS